jgi:ElaB/YqjD/DUF883 family membrane-anchored ribosome-binding protein
VLATKGPFRSVPWSAVETDARKIWETKEPRHVGAEQGCRALLVGESAQHTLGPIGGMSRRSGRQEPGACTEGARRQGRALALPPFCGSLTRKEGFTVSTDYGRQSGMSTHGAGIDRPGDGEGDGDRTNVSQTANAVQRTLGKARGYVQSAVGQTRNKMTEYREHGWGRVQGDVVESTRSQPLAALGIAAAIGLLLGWLSSTARR